MGYSKRRKSVQVNSVIDWKAIREAAAQAAKRPEPPSGYFTRQMYQDETGHCRAHAGAIISGMVSKGLLDKVLIAGRPWYGLMKKEKDIG